MRFCHQNFHRNKAYKTLETVQCFKRYVLNNMPKKDDLLLYILVVRGRQTQPKQIPAGKILCMAKYQWPYLAISTMPYTWRISRILRKYLHISTTLNSILKSIQGSNDLKNMSQIEHVNFHIRHLVCF